MTVHVRPHVVGFRVDEHTFAFAATGTALTDNPAFSGILKNLHLVVPDFTNTVTTTVSLVDADGRTLWTSAAKDQNASYNLESETEFLDQVVTPDMLWTITISGVAGGSGGNVVLIPRYVGM